MIYTCLKTLNRPYILILVHQNILQIRSARNPYFQGSGLLSFITILVFFRINVRCPRVVLSNNEY